MRTSISRNLLVVTAVLALALGAVAGFVGRSLAEAPPQPHMREALAALRSAQNHLNQATPDKGGHRAAALHHVQEAITATQAGIDYDNHHR